MDNKQKHKCFGCVWSNDVGTHYYCPWQECKKDVKENGNTPTTQLPTSGMQQSNDR